MTHLIMSSVDNLDAYTRADNALYMSPFADTPRPDILVEVYTEFDDSYFTAWPMGRVLGGSPAAISGIVSQDSWDPFTRTSNWTGHLGWQTVSGITRDKNSAALPSCTVHLFRTSDDLEMSMSTSDPTTGAYSLYTSDTGNHYVVAYLPGSPDVAGTSVNTLVGV